MVRTIRSENSLLFANEARELREKEIAYINELPTHMALESSGIFVEIHKAIKRGDNFIDFTWETKYHSRANEFCNFLVNNLEYTVYKNPQTYRITVYFD